GHHAARGQPAPAGTGARNRGPPRGGGLMKARSLEGEELELPPESVEGLRSRLRGPLLAPGDPGYDATRSLWNAMIDRRPALVARCLGTADVIAGVGFARERGLLLSIKGGGHNIAGLAVAE